jgi:hypothetical protein
MSDSPETGRGRHMNIYIYRAKISQQAMYTFKPGTGDAERIMKDSGFRQIKHMKVSGNQRLSQILHKVNAEVGDIIKIRSPDMIAYYARLFDDYMEIETKQLETA